jgi:hypothetical protein
MSHKTHLVARIVFICLCVTVVMCRAQESLAQFDRISFSFAGGAGYVSLDDWKDFFSGVSSSHFEKDRLGTYSEFRAAYHLACNHAIALNIENISASASLYEANALTDPHGELTGYASSVVEWDFSATPIGLSYEFCPNGCEEKVIPFLGIGASYFFTKVDHKSYFLHDGFFGNLSSEGTRDGEGYGLHVYAGVQCKLTRHLLILSRLRARYADGMALTDKKGAVKVEFTGFDFTIGWGWRF